MSVRGVNEVQVAPHKRASGRSKVRLGILAPHVRVAVRMLVRVIAARTSSEYKREDEEGCERL